ncbi:hypothetical protein ES703_78204 [subsurface metagenome]
MTPPLLRLLLHVIGNVTVFEVPAIFIHIKDGPHVDQINEAGVEVSGTDRQYYWRRIGPQTFLHHVQHVIEICAGTIHFVHKSDPGDTVPVGLAPHGFRLGLHATHSAENSDGTIEDAQRALHLHGKVDMAGGIDDVDAMAVPEAGGGSRGNGYAPLFLLIHPIHSGRPIVNLTHPMNPSRVVKDALGSGGLTGIDVGHDPDVANVF